MYKYDNQEGEKYSNIRRKCERSSIVKAILSGVAAFIAFKLFNEASSEAGYAHCIDRYGADLNDVLNRMRKKGEISADDFDKACREHAEAVKKDLQK